MPTSEPVANLNLPEDVSDLQQRRQTRFPRLAHRNHALAHGGQSELEARIASYELAFRMQRRRPKPWISRAIGGDEAALPAWTKNPPRFAHVPPVPKARGQRGVRFVQLYRGGEQVGRHSDIEGNHSKLCRATDKPIAGLLKILKRAALLDDTLVVWGGEIWPYAAEREGHRPRSQSDRLHDVDGGRGQGVRRSEQTDEVACTPCRTGCTCTICTRRFSGCSGR